MSLLWKWNWKLTINLQIGCEIGFKCFFLSSQGVPGYKSHKRMVTRNVNCQLGVKFIQFDFKTLTKYKWNWNVIRIYLGLSVNTKNLHVEIICRILRQISSCGLNYSKIFKYRIIHSPLIWETQPIQSRSDSPRDINFAKYETPYNLHLNSRGWGG